MKTLILDTSDSGRHLAEARQALQAARRSEARLSARLASKHAAAPDWSIAAPALVQAEGFIRGQLATGCSYPEAMRRAAIVMNVRNGGSL